MRLALIVATMLVVASPAVADGKYDGLWRPVPILLPGGKTIDPYNCVPQEVDGATPIKGNWYGEMESDCTMENPTDVRGLDGTLFDVTCKATGVRRQRDSFSCCIATRTTERGS